LEQSRGVLELRGDGTELPVVEGVEQETRWLVEIRKEVARKGVP